MTHRLAKRWILLASVAVLPIARTATADDKAACIDAAGEGQKLRDAHKLIDARDKFRVCAAATCPAVVQGDCAGWLDAVEKAQPTVVFEAKDAAGKELSAVKVSMDGRALAESLDGSALAVDPGPHAFQLVTVGKPAVTTQLFLHEGEKGRVERVDFGGAAASATAERPSQRAVTSQQDQTTASPESSARGPDTTRRIVGYAVGGAAAVALGLGLYYELTAQSRDSDSNKAASSSNPDVQATAHGIYQQASQAQTYAIISTGVGVAALGAGLYLVLTSGSKAGGSASRVTVGPLVSERAGGVSLGGTW